MRAILQATLRTAGAALLIGVLAASRAPDARAEAPFFYDPLGEHAIYDPEFYPMNRTAGFLSLVAQAWSVPGAGDRDEPLFDQEFEGQYRMLWNFTLDPAYALKLELKASTRDNVVGEDYFLRSEFLYQGLEAPLFLYGGIKLPEEGDFLFYGGIESLSYTLMDLMPSSSANLPLALRGFAEVRTLVEGDGDPTLRLMALVHTIPTFAVENLTLGLSLDSFYTEAGKPVFRLQGQAEYRVGSGFMRWGVLGGYAVDLADSEQRLSLGVQAELF
jgi:hypothetical protein